MKTQYSLFIVVSLNLSPFAERSVKGEFYGLDFTSTLQCG